MKFSFKSLLVEKNSTFMQKLPASNPNAHPLAVKIPHEIFQCAQKLKDYAETHGWTGFNGNDLWSLNGIGGINNYNKRIYLLESRLDHVEKAWIKSNEFREDAQFKLKLLQHACELLAKDFACKDQQEALERLLDRLKEQ